jgi:hypothetical protein
MPSTSHLQPGEEANSDDGYFHKNKEDYPVDYPRHSAAD